MREPVYGIALFLLFLFSSSAICFSQTDPNNLPQPPVEELKKFQPFLGRYQHKNADFAELKWTGTMEIKKSIKGWYVEWIILNRTKGIDRELKVLMLGTVMQKKNIALGGLTLFPLFRAMKKKAKSDLMATS